MIGVCPEMKKIYLYLRVTSVAEHDLLWCGASPPHLPSYLYVSLVFIGRILARTPRWLKFTADQPLASQVLASQTYQEPQLPSGFSLLLPAQRFCGRGHVGEASVFRKGASDLVWI